MLAGNCPVAVAWPGRIPRQEGQRRCGGQKSFEQVSRVIQAPLQDVIVDKPETASQKYALTRRKSVGALTGVIPQHKAVANQAGFDRGQCTADPSIGWRQEANHRDEQKTGVERFRTI